MPCADKTNMMEEDGTEAKVDVQIYPLDFSQSPIGAASCLIPNENNTLDEEAIGSSLDSGNELSPDLDSLPKSSGFVFDDPTHEEDQTTILPNEPEIIHSSENHSKDLTGGIKVEDVEISISNCAETNPIHGVSSMPQLSCDAFSSSEMKASSKRFNGAGLLTATQSVDREDFTATTSLWDWPLNEDGLAKAVESYDKFTVTLTFGYLQRCVEVRSFENCNSATNSSWSVGLSPPETEEKSRYFWRLEIQVVRKLNLVVIEAFREMRRTTKGRHLKKVRKMYRIPAGFDMETLQTRVTGSGSVIFECKRKESVRRKISKQ